jgi:hypothetical protein
MTRIYIQSCLEKSLLAPLSLIKNKLNNRLEICLAPKMTSNKILQRKYKLLQTSITKTADAFLEKIINKCVVRENWQMRSKETSQSPMSFFK